MNYGNFLKLIVSFLLIIVLLGGTFYFSESATAQEEVSDLRILYQGNLSDSEGNPVEDGKYNMRFAIYDSETEGNILWQEEHTFYNTIFVKDSQFKIILGRMVSVNLDLDQGPFWLGVAVGQETEEGKIVWDIGMEPRKKIVSLSDLLKEEGLGSLREDGVTEEEWEVIFQLIEEKLGEQPDLVVLFNLEQIEEAASGGSVDSNFQLFNVLKNLINFISEKLSEIGEKINEMLVRLDEIVSALSNIGNKIDVLYQVLVIDKGLAPAENLSVPSEGTIYANQKVERLIFRKGETSIRISNQAIKEESLIFVSFLDDPGDGWWISEKVPGHSFTISMGDPAPQDLRFDYWVLDEEGVQQPEEELPQKRRRRRNFRR
jgi:hypothetical protein